LNALWILGTLGTKIIDREWVINELNRHRPLIGDCLRFFAASFPIGFLEPSFNSNNKYSIMYGATADNLSGDALEGLGRYYLFIYLNLFFEPILIMLFMFLRKHKQSI
jgi:hypothetical protein